MNIKHELTDKVILEELGQRLARHRIERGLTQAQLAKEAGISKRTLERMEAGATAQTVTLIRLLRALGLLEGLEQLIPPATPRPMELLKLKGKTRQRASSKSAEKTAQKAWSWDDTQ